MRLLGESYSSGGPTLPPWTELRKLMDIKIEFIHLLVSCGSALEKYTSKYIANICAQVIFVQNKHSVKKFVESLTSWKGMVPYNPVLP